MNDAFFQAQCIITGVTIGLDMALVVMQIIKGNLSGSRRMILKNKRGFFRWSLSVAKMNDVIDKIRRSEYQNKSDEEKACREKAQEFIESWIITARSVENKFINDIADTIENHRQGILNFYEYPISTGPLEGINNKIKVLKRIAYGYQDMEFFKLGILFIRNTKFMLAGA